MEFNLFDLIASGNEGLPLWYYILSISLGVLGLFTTLFYFFLILRQIKKLGASDLKKRLRGIRVMAIALSLRQLNVVILGMIAFTTDNSSQFLHLTFFQTVPWFVFFFPNVPKDFTI